jgi:HEAT repeat protein
MRSYLVATLLLSCAALAAQDLRTKDVRDIGKGGVSAIPRLQELLQNPNRDIRIEVVRQLTAIGTQHSLDPLIAATKDADPDVQMRATDGLVNFYLPGYVQSGLSGSLKRVGGGIKGHFTDTDDQIIPAYVTVRPEVIAALGSVASKEGSTDARANACRAIGILRGRAAIPNLLDAAHSKNSDVIFESLIALQKIRDESAGPKVEFLFHDLDSRVQGTALETAGLLRDMGAVPSITDVLNRARNIQVKRSALTALAMLPEETSRPIYQQYLRDKDEKLRAAAAEGFGRLHNPSDLPTLEKAWQDEAKIPTRLSLAFAQVMLGKTEISEFSPLQFLINNLDSASYKGVAIPYLVELARDEKVRQALYPTLASGTKDEKIGLAGVLARSGDQSSLAPLQKLTSDPDGDVSKEALRAVRVLQARLQG